MWFSLLAGAAMKSAFVLAAAWLLTLALRRRSAAARHVVWTLALAAILVLPFLSAALPALRVALPAPAAVVFHTNVWAPAHAGAAQIPEAREAATAAHPAGWRPAWRIWLLLLWAAGAAIMIARTLVAYIIAWHMRRAAGPFPHADVCTAMAKTLGVRRRVAVLAARPGSMPMALGVWRPVILVPADASAWSAGQRRNVLLHELAHVRRGDAATHLLARLAAALYWWNPLAWTAWREFIKERERAADDLVLSAGARASEYAGHLLEVARSMQTSSAIAWAAAGIARRSELEGRLLAILDSRANRTAPGRVTVFAGALMAMAIVVPLAAVRAQEEPQRAIPADVDATVRAARAQKNYAVLESAAKAATQARQYDVAQKLLESALAIRAEDAGQQSVEYGEGLVNLAELEQRRDPKSGADRYARAAQILGERPEAARALTHLGLAACAKHDYAQAFAQFQHARQVDPKRAGMALMWMAVVRQREGDADDAGRLFESAMAAQDPQSVDAAVIMEVYAQFLRRQGRADQAGELEVRASAIQRANAGPARATPAGAYRVGHDVLTPSPVQRVEPQYSDEARAALLQGTVVVQVVIGTDGLTHDARILRGLGLGLDENALEAISQWRFKPGVKDGNSVKVAATIEVNYRLF